MTNSKWGTKRTCLGCGKRFYDMQRNPIVCPSCDTPFEINRPENPRRPRAGAKPKPVSVVEAPVESPAKSDGDDAKMDASETNGTEDIAEAEKNMSAMARSFWRDNRVVDNRRIKKELGVTLRYPDYRVGLRAILAEESGA